MVQQLDPTRCGDVAAAVVVDSAGKTTIVARNRPPPAYCGALISQFEFWHFVLLLYKNKSNNDKEGRIQMPVKAEKTNEHRKKNTPLTCQRHTTR